MARFQTLDELDEAVAEYLAYRRFVNTVDCLRSEIRHSKLRRDRMLTGGNDAGGRAERKSADEDDATARRRRAQAKIATIQAFDGGHMIDFLGSWTAFVPKKLLRRDASSTLSRKARVTEFLSCVHCATLPFRPASLSTADGPRVASVACAKAMTNFRRYLDGRGRVLAQDREVVSFYALPHVPDPAAHPAFDFLFRDDWVIDFRARLMEFFGEVEAFLAAEPILVRLLLQPDQSTQNGSLQASLSHSLDVLVDYAEAGLTPRDTPSMLPEKGGPLSTGNTENNAPQEAPEAKPRRREIGGKTSQRGFDDGGGVQDGGDGNGTKPSGTDLKMRARSDSDRAILAPVDYERIKIDLRRLAEEASDPHGKNPAQAEHVENDGKCENGTVGDRGGSTPSPAPVGRERCRFAAIEAALLLQAIRWRFSRAPPGKTRRGVLFHLIRHDIFGLRARDCGNGLEDVDEAGHLRGESLLRIMLVGAPPVAAFEPGKHTTEQDTVATEKGDMPALSVVKDEPWREYDGQPGHLVAEYAMRLLHAIVSLSKARSYVLGQACDDMTGLLMHALQTQNFKQTALATSLLGTLQKLSVRGSAQEALIRVQFVDWGSKAVAAFSSQGNVELPDDPSPRALRHTIAILENISKSVQGRTAILAVDPDMIESFSNLLECEDRRVRRNACHALESLMQAPEGRERATAVGMDAHLQDLRNRTEDADPFSRDIDTLLEALLVGSQNEDGSKSKASPRIGSPSEAMDPLEAGDGVSEDFDYLSDGEAEASVISHFIDATKPACGEELLRDYRLSTTDIKMEPERVDGGWGEEELVCGSFKRKGGCEYTRGGSSVGEAKGDGGMFRPPTPEAGSATVIDGEQKVYDSRRPGVPEEMQSRPRIPRTPAGSATAAPDNQSFPDDKPARGD